MKSTILFILAILFSAQVCFAQKKVTTINWEAERPLTWNDFKGQALSSSLWGAMTYGALNYSFKNISGNNYLLIIEVTFDTKKSWVKPKEKTDYLLAHEQCHFDMYEIYERIFVKKLKKENVLTGKNMNDKIQKTFLKTFNELSRFQDKYDKETNHSKDAEKQSEWSIKIKKLLDENKEFAKREIEVIL